MGRNGVTLQVGKSFEKLDNSAVILKDIISVLNGGAGANTDEHTPVISKVLKIRYNALIFLAIGQLQHLHHEHSTLKKTSLNRIG